MSSATPFPVPDTFVDVAFARKLELNEMLAPLDYVRLQQTLHPELGFTWQDIAGGYAFYAGEGSPLNQAVGLGLHGPVLAAEFEEFEEFFRSRKSPAQLVLCPLADESLMQMAAGRGYRVTEFNSVLYLRIPHGYCAPPTSLQIERVNGSDSLAWAEILIEGFEAVGVFSPDLFEPYATLPNATCFLARMDGKIIGGAAGTIYPEHGVAAMFGAATLPAYRARGGQTALLRARLQAASQAGCDLAIICTQPGSGSQRNAERQGFRVAYTKVVMVREFS